MNVLDVLIVGAGPIGIELAVAVKRAGLRYAHVDAGQIGSTIGWYAPQTHFFSSPERIAIAGVPLLTLDQSKATREEYLAYLRSIVLQFDLEVRTFEPVTAIERGPDGVLTVTTSTREGEATTPARAVVLAIGDMHRPRLIGVPGEELPHVSHYFDDPHAYFRRRVLIIGGRNSAVEAAIRCVRIGSRVTLAHRGRELDQKHIKFWLYPEIAAMVRDGRLTVLDQTTVQEIRRDAVTLEGPSGSFDVEADSVLLLTGYEQDSSLFRAAGIELIGPARRPNVDERTMETNVPGLFVAGTAVAGTQGGGEREFIETTHVHVDRIVAALSGRVSTAERPAYSAPES